MKNINSFFTNCSLFSGMLEEDLAQILDCLAETTKKYEKDQIIFITGSPLHQFGLVVTGSVMIVREDFWGNRNIIGNVPAGEVFAESFALSYPADFPFSVIAREQTEILFLKPEKILQTCAEACTVHHQLIKNLVGIISEKNIRLTEKIEHISRRSTREKILSYLSDMAGKTKNVSFSIPFSRQELADYLSVDRSAMCTELGKLKNEGILEINKKSFTLLRNVD